MVRLVEGQIVEDDEGGGITREGLCRVLRFQSTINFLGFRVPLYWSCVAAIFAWLKFGAAGLVFVGVIAGEAAEDEKGRWCAMFLVLLGFRRKTFLLCPLRVLFPAVLQLPHRGGTAIPRLHTYFFVHRGSVLRECRQHYCVVSRADGENEVGGEGQTGGKPGQAM